VRFRAISPAERLVGGHAGPDRPLNHIADRAELVGEQIFDAAGQHPGGGPGGDEADVGVGVGDHHLGIALAVIADLHFGKGHGDRLRGGGGGGHGVRPGGGGCRELHQTCSVRAVDEAGLGGGRPDRGQAVFANRLPVHQAR
jgi:hypothetical protein